MFTAFHRIIRAALRDCARNIGLTVTTVAILALTIVSAHVLLLVHAMGRVAIRAIESKVDVRVQLQPTVSESDADALRIALGRRPEIAHVNQRSRAQVLDDFQHEHAGDAGILDALSELGENPFGPELRIALRSPADFPIVAKFLAESELAPKIAGTTTADRAALASGLTELTRRVRVGGLVVSGILIALTLLIIANAVRIATYARRDEVGIMALVGAPRWFVRLPFLVSGIVATAIATAIAALITAGGLRIAAPALAAFLGPDAGLDILAFFRQHGVTIVLTEFLVLSLLTSSIASLALRRYLRV